jgi:hypothetical protein
MRSGDINANATFEIKGAVSCTAASMELDMVNAFPG